MLLGQSAGVENLPIPGNDDCRKAERVKYSSKAFDIRYFVGSSSNAFHDSSILTDY